MQEYINNANLMPFYVPDSEVKIEGKYTPDWVKTLVMAQVHLETLLEGKTLKEADFILDHYEEMGVNGLWVTPVFDRALNEGCNGYHNFGPHTIFPGLTGEEDYSKGWSVYKEFVEKAHMRNIRIIQDIVSWGVNPVAPMVKEYPQFFDGQPNKDWGGLRFCWEKEEFKSWYLDRVVEMVLYTDIDGLRYDVEPRYAGWEVQKEIRDRLLAKGKKICSMSELGNIDEQHPEVYDFEQLGVIDNCAGNRHLDAPWVFINYHNIVDSVKTGKNIGSPNSKGEQGCNRFYMHDIIDHDCWCKGINGNRLAIGYQGIFAPFIPLWWQGEEWNNDKIRVYGAVNYFDRIDWSLMEKPENRAFYEDVKSMIRIRRQYPEIFNYYPQDHRDSNILSVTIEGNNHLVGYARYFEDTAILILPNNRGDGCETEFTVDITNLNTQMGIPEKDIYHIEDLQTGELINHGASSQVARFKLSIPDQNMRILKVTFTI